VKATPQLAKNPNDADISDYPKAKEDQMALAKVLAATIEGKWQKTPEQS